MWAGIPIDIDITIATGPVDHAILRYKDAHSLSHFYRAAERVVYLSRVSAASLIL